jgi:periplasmic protein TonB
MSVQRWPTLSAALFAVVVHTILLWVAASLRVSLARESPALVSITLVQQATLLPVADNVGETPHAAPMPFPLPSPPMSKPLKRKRVAAPKPSVTKSLLPLPQSPRVNPHTVPPRRRKSVLPPQPREDVPPVAAPPLTVASQEGDTPSAFPLSDGTQTDDVEMAAPQNNGTRGNDNAASAAAGGASGAGEEDGKGARGSGESALAQPHYGVNPKPVYPLLARRMGAQGEVLLRVRVRQDGSVAAVEIVHSSGFALLDEAATRTVRDNWRFIPARLDGVAIESWVEIPIKFVLAES